MPGIVFALYGKNKNVDVKLLLLISTAIVISTSVQGIAILIITVIIWAIFVKKLNKKEIFRGIIGFILFVAVLFVVKYLGIADTAFIRIKNIFNGNLDNSSSMRLLRGFVFWWRHRCDGIAG